jgi:hypothetical protein
VNDRRRLGWRRTFFRTLVVVTYCGRRFSIVPLRQPQICETTMPRNLGWSTQLNGNLYRPAGTPSDYLPAPLSAPAGLRLRGGGAVLARLAGCGHLRPSGAAHSEEGRAKRGRCQIHCTGFHRVPLRLRVRLPPRVVLRLRFSFASTRLWQSEAKRCPPKTVPSITYLKLPVAPKPSQ